MSLGVATGFPCCLRWQVTFFLLQLLLPLPLTLCASDGATLCDHCRRHTFKPSSSMAPKPSSQRPRSCHLPHASKTRQVDGRTPVCLWHGAGGTPSSCGRGSLLRLWMSRVVIAKTLDQPSCKCLTVKWLMKLRGCGGERAGKWNDSDDDTDVADAADSDLIQNHESDPSRHGCV